MRNKQKTKPREPVKKFTPALPRHPANRAKRKWMIPTKIRPVGRHTKYPRDLSSLYGARSAVGEKGGKMTENPKNAALAQIIWGDPRAESRSAKAAAWVSRAQLTTEGTGKRLKKKLTKEATIGAQTENIRTA